MGTLHHVDDLVLLDDNAGETSPVHGSGSQRPSRRGLFGVTRCHQLRVSDLQSPDPARINVLNSDPVVRIAETRRYDAAAGAGLTHRFPRTHR